MERDPRSPQPTPPGGRALERLRQFEQERGLEPTSVPLPEDGENAPAGEAPECDPGGEGGGTDDEPPEGGPEG